MHDGQEPQEGPAISELEALMIIRDQLDKAFDNVKETVLVLRNRNRALEARVAELEGEMKVAAPKGI